jgi:hypothetical protein
MQYLAFHSGLVAVLLVAACSPQASRSGEGDSFDPADSAVTVADAAGARDDAGAAAGQGGPAGDDVRASGDGGAAAGEAAGAAGSDGGDGRGWHGPLMVVAVGNDGRHMVSVDGTNWTADTRETMGNAEGPKLLRAVAYGNQVVVAVGGGCSPDCVARIVTFDGRSWTDAALPPGQGRLTGVAYGVVAGQGWWVAVGDGGTVLRSPDDGRTWVPAPVPGPSGLRAVAFGKVGATDMFVAAGDGYTRARSLDGATCTDVQPASGSSSSSEGFRAVTIGGGFVVAVGTGRSNTGRRVRSADGIVWTDEANSSPDLLSVVYADDRFMAFSGSGDNAVYVSPDGAASSWMRQTTVNAGANVAAGVLAAGRLFVSRVSPSSIRISADGISWVARTQSRQGDSQINAFVFAGS